MRTVALIALLFGAATTLAAPDQYRDVVLADSPLLYYRLNEAAGNAINAGSLGADFDGAYNGPVLRSQATAGGDDGVRFAGAGTFIESLSAAPAGLTGNPDFTIEAIVRIASDASSTLYPPFLGWGPPGTGNSVYFSPRFNDADLVYTGFYNAGLRGTARLCRDRWVHIVWVRDSGGGTHDSETGSTVYVNGAVVSTTRDEVLNPGFDASLTIGSTTFLINRHTDLTRHSNIEMDEVALYDTLLLPQQVQAHWQAYATNLDNDSDGLDNSLDNCLLHANPTQLDSSGDAFGNRCDPDLNNDFGVNFVDLTAVKAAFFSTPASPSWNPDADFDGSGQVNFGDLQIIKAFFFGRPGPSAGVNFCSAPF